MMNKSNLRTVLVLVVTTVVILGGVWLVQAQPWKPQDPSAVSTVDVQIPAGQVGPAVGAVSADFTASTIDGQTITLSGLRGQPVWLVFGATWCTNCRAEAPDVNTVAQTFDGKVKVVSIYVGEDTSTVKGYADRLKLVTPQIADTSSQISSAYSVAGIPAHFFIDSNGVIQKISVGSITQKTATSILDELS